MRGNNVIDPNDGSMVTPIGEDEEDDSEDAEGMEDAPNVELISVNSTKTLSQLRLMIPFLYYR